MFGDLGYSVEFEVRDLGSRVVCGRTCKAYLEGQGDLVSGLIMGMIRATIWVIGVIKPLTKSP